MAVYAHAVVKVRSGGPIESVRDGAGSPTYLLIAGLGLRQRMFGLFWQTCVIHLGWLWIFAILAVGLIVCRSWCKTGWFALPLEASLRPAKLSLPRVSFLDYCCVCVAYIAPTYLIITPFFDPVKHQFCKQTNLFCCAQNPQEAKIRMQGRI